MDKGERLAEAEQLLARERLLQEMRTAAMEQQRAARKKLLWVCVPLGSVLGGIVGPMIDAPFLLPSILGTAAGWLAAVLLARRAG